MHFSTCTVAAAAVLLGTAAALPPQPVARDTDRWDSNEKKKDYNIYIEYTKKKVSWGSLRPADVVMQLKDDCMDVSCSDSASFTRDSNFIDDKGVMLEGELEITVDGSFSGSSDADDELKLSGMVDMAREALIDLGSYEVRTAADDDGGCGPSNDMICTPDKVEKAQYENVQGLAIRIEGKDKKMISYLDITVEPEATDSGEACGDVSALGGYIAGHLNPLLSEGFQFMGLVCGLTS